MMPTSNSDTSSNRQIELDSPFADLEEEFANTRRALERFPDEHADWRPHQKSPTLIGLAAHVAHLPHFGEAIASGPVFDFATTPYVPPTARTRAELLELFDRTSASARAVVASLDDDALRDTWTFRNGDTVIASGPRGYYVRRFMLSHIIHHRAQLTIYYRLLGVPVPGLYGPSADEGM
jgi:uncharacterized damage-inducible protein DinB